jgi:hypothetical protein
MKKFLYLTLTAVMLFAGCSEDDPAPELSVDPTAIAAVAEAGNYSIAITSNAAWIATKETEWLSLNAASGTGNGTVIVNVAANPTVEPRTGNVLIISGMLSHTIAVTQAGMDVLLNVDPATLAADANTGEYTLTVTSNTAWTVSAGAEWLALNPASGTGNGTVKVTVSENPSLEIRTAPVNFASGPVNHAVNVTQAARQFYAASTQTWVVGNQTWSDAILLPECDKEEFGAVGPQCRSFTHPTTGEIWFYYNGAFVLQNTTALCPEPWHVATSEDFINLDIALGGTGENRADVPIEWINAQYITVWGGTWGGLIFTTDPLGIGDGGFYWSSTFDGANIHGLSYSSLGNVNPDIFDTGGFGLQIRCVK